jgi:hypothetical protein
MPGAKHYLSTQRSHHLELAVQGMTIAGLIALLLVVSDHSYT